MNGLVLYVKESYNELVHKVTWPSWPSLLSSTRLVLVASVIIALIIFVMDLIFNGVLLQNLYKVKF
ncbi:preprotein translocase subunit SecE [Portibacter marinus]|uniref:preprotein translocase subunit SecE n=1 Tax=Portibacter marinus TaxID=2898660 RepID=UPI001F196CBC|nr:preprotein translocase subunit SecE [Portibacter marinus]